MSLRSTGQHASGNVTGTTVVARCLLTDDREGERQRSWRATGDRTGCVPRRVPIAELRRGTDADAPIWARHEWCFGRGSAPAVHCFASLFWLALNVQREIVSFRQDDVGDWVAELGCHH